MAISSTSWKPGTAPTVTHFKPGHKTWNEGAELSREHREKVRKAALKREASIRQSVVVNGVKYPNYSQAAKATGLSPRSIKRYALSDKSEHASYRLG